MQTADVADILTAARQLSDTETTDGTVDFETDTELAAYLTKAYRQLVNDIIKFGGLRLLVKNEELTSPYALATDGILRVVGLEVPDGDGWTELREFNWRERNEYTSTNYPAWRWLPGSGAHGELQFFPETAAPASVRIWYIPDIVPIEADDTISTFLGWDDYLAARVAMMILAKEERSNAAVSDEFKLARESVMSACASLNPAAYDHVQDVQRVDEDFVDLQTPWRWRRLP